ncbi:MAG: hypothetical protein H3C50_08570 [Kiritimatiellae bacterium]|nr:hypothetical protein [Kiritimatiellia bacterium]MCO5067371.1 hypothetical protein [Kiritimatiellia bacterium]
MSCVVIVPCFKRALSADERNSLAQCRRVLGRHEIRVMCPAGLLLPPECEGLDREEFPAPFFADIDGYSRLLLSREFYERFRAWDYLLIYQLDAFVFRDELNAWCLRGYDYVGAPWGKRDLLRNRHVRKSRPWMLRYPWIARWWHRRDFKVGNGGLSLRRVAAFLTILRSHGDASAKWMGNEDLFWSLLVPAMDRTFRIPREEEAMYFALELEPSQYVARMNGQLPFGCHAWMKYDADFWAAYIPVGEGGAQ